jgi:hypothetical protein
MSLGARVSTLRDLLAVHPYENSAGEFVRFRAQGNDDVVAGIVRGVVAEGAEGCEAFRHGLGEAQVETLRLFCMRRALHARRQSSSGPVYEAIDGLSLLPGLDDVPWDTWLKAALFVGRSLGVDPAMIRSRFADLASAPAAARFDVAMEAMNRVDQLSQCRIVEVSTSHGIGFVENLLFRDTAGRGLVGALYGAPRLTDNQIGYHPTTNLAQLAADLADALDASGTVVTYPLSQDQLAATSFSITASGSYLSTTGCLSFVADVAHAGASFTAFVAELPEDTDVQALADAAASTDDQAAFHDSRRLIVLSPQPNFDENVDVVIDLHQFDELATTVLAEPSTR